MSEEPDLIDEEEVVTPPTEEEVSSLAGKFASLQSRCKAAKIEFAQAMTEDGDPYAMISLPSGRNKREIRVFTERKADLLLSLEFEQFRFLSGYDAICSYQNHYIEAGLRATSTSPHYILSRLNGAMPYSFSAELHAFTLDPPETLPGRPVLEIGPCSTEFRALGANRTSRTLTLKLKGARASQHDQALIELRSFADSLFFQIVNLFGSTFILERQSPTRLSPPSRRQSDIEIVYPTAQYNDEAASLYWYAKSARGMPLLRFLAFYQSIEFYFPRYSQVEARKRVGAIIKQPTFRPYRDDDLDKLVSAIQPARNGGLGSERSQLRSVVTECISANDIRAYLMANKEREEHFAGKTSKAKYHKIPLHNRAVDLRNDVADRIYDIRCKIVHTKNEHAEDDVPMILPFSEDADYLYQDIDLVEYVATQVLVFSSGELP